MKELKDDSTSRSYDVGFFGRYEFFLYTTSVGVIIAIVSLVGLITGRLEKKIGSVAVSLQPSFVTSKFMNKRASIFLKA